MNYCQSCRRHLNGAVSCPGCGAVAVAPPEAQEPPRSTDWTTEVAWPGRDPLPATQSRVAQHRDAQNQAAAAAIDERVRRGVAHADSRGETRADARSEARAGGSHAMPPRPPLHTDKSDEGETALTRAAEPKADKAADAHPPRGDRSRRSRKRRGLGLGATVTGGFAGIAVIGLLVLGNLPTADGNGAPVGAAATESASAPQSPGASSTSTVPTPMATGSNAEPASSARNPSTSPSSSTSQKPATESAASTQARQGQSTAPVVVASSSGTQTTPPATQTTKPSSASPSPSPSQTHVTCVLVICW